MEECNSEQDVMLNGSENLMSTSVTSSNGGGAGADTNGCGKKTAITSPDATSYVAKARVTRPTPPPPSYNPMQFVQIKPCHLYQTAQQQLKKAEEVKKLKEVKKEEPEEWQNNLDNWKSSRRKRVEHIIDRVVETKKLELEEHDRTRRKSKTFTEMMEERAERGGSRGRAKLASLAVYNEDEANDLSDLGIGTSSASGKSSLSEDYDNNSVMSDNAVELDKAIGAGAGAGGSSSIEEQQNHINSNNASKAQNSTTSSNNSMATTKPANAAGIGGGSDGGRREYISSPGGYETSSSIAAASSSPDPCEYTYEGAIQDYKQRVQRASNNCKLPASNNNVKLTTNSNGEEIAYPTRRGSKIEDRLSGFEVTSPSDTQEGVEKQKVDVPKVDISKRKEIFEQRESSEASKSNSNAGSAPPKVLLRNALTNGNGGNSNGGAAVPEPAAKKEVKRLSGDISSIRDRMQSLEQQRNAFNTSKSVDVPVPPLKQRLNSLQSAVTKEGEQQKKPPLVALIDARQLEIMRGEEERMRQQQQQQQQKQQKPPALVVEEPPPHAATNDDSGIQTDAEEREREREQEQQLNAAIAALAIEERQLEEAANAVNQIEAEFAELTDLNPSPLPAQQPAATPQKQKRELSAQPKVQPAQPQPQLQLQPAPPSQPVAAPQPARDMEFSVSSTNNLLPTTTQSAATMLNSSTSVLSSSAGQPAGQDVHVVVDDVAVATVSGNEVIIAPKALSNPPPVNPTPNASLPETGNPGNCNLRRKPSNEMVHARNLLKMFKDTFQQDDELNEQPELASTTAPPSEPVKSPTGSGVVTQIFDFTKPNQTNATAQPLGQVARTAPAPSPTPAAAAVVTPNTASSSSSSCSTQIPRAVTPNNPIGKPPMSPKALRYNPKASQVTSPNAQQAAQPFSINGRVEIFNSKQMEKPPTPTLSPKRPHPLALPPPAVGAVKPSAEAAATAAPATEVVICAPPVTIVNPDELPKPNTVKALSSCFIKSEKAAVAPAPPPKPLPRSRIPQLTPPQSPTPAKRAANSQPVEAAVVQERSSGDYAPVHGQTQAIVHSPPKPAERSKPTTPTAAPADPLAPNDSIRPHVTQPSGMPALLVCAPNESSLFKLASSAPQSPVSPRAAPVEEIALCQQFLNSQAPKGLELAPEDSEFIRQLTVEELPCDKVDVAKQPLPCTGFQDVSMAELQRCDGCVAESPVEPPIAPSELDIALCAGFLDSFAPPSDTLKQPAAPQRQRTVEEPPCESIDVRHEPMPATGFQDISVMDVKRCDGVLAAAPARSSPNSPIMAARAAHSKALIDTCEQIIAEERLASSQMMRSSLPETAKCSSTSNSTPLLARKSKIPIPKACCISASGTDSLNRTGYAPANTTEKAKEAEQEQQDNNCLIARTHVVETEIKVTTTTPPSSPKPVTTPTLTSSTAATPTKEKKTKNIFDFLRRNFGHHEEQQPHTTLNETIAPNVVLTSTRSGVDVISGDAPKAQADADCVKVENSKFYVASDEAAVVVPPPLPKTPAPVNIEIRKTITTDEILEANNTERALTEEISNMLDDEFNKLEAESARDLASKQ